MKTTTLVRRTLLPVPPEVAFAWHARPGALERLLPPWEKAQIVRRSGGIDPGEQVEVRTSLGPLPIRWLAEHRECQPPRRFRDVQLAGPFSAWDHEHVFEPDGHGQCFLEDRVEYAIPGGALGRWLVGGFVEQKLERMFAYRHRTTAIDLALHARYATLPRQTIAVTGASGLIGSALVPFLTTGGHGVLRLARGKAAGGNQPTAHWDPETGEIDAESLEGIDAVVHLAGESLAQGRWTAAKKQRLRDSRVEGTRRLCAALTRLRRRPRTLVCASAIGYYGDRGDEKLDENSPPGQGFLAALCRDWESATMPAVQAGMRVVHLRLGMVLAGTGGALQKLILPFRCGLGGWIGSGRQSWSWISLNDALGAAYHALMRADLAGPVNAVSPHPETAAEFAQVLGEVLNRPAAIPFPSPAARWLLGERAQELLLASARVFPRQLLETGYEFTHAELETALRHVLGRG